MGSETVKYRKVPYITQDRVQRYTPNVRRGGNGQRYIVSYTVTVITEDS